MGSYEEFLREMSDILFKRCIRDKYWCVVFHCPELYENGFNDGIYKRSRKIDNQGEAIRIMADLNGKYKEELKEHGYEFSVKEYGKDEDPYEY